MFTPYRKCGYGYMKLGIEGKRDISAAHPKNVRDLEQNCANLVVTARVIRNVLHRDQA
jgi:hypothetical protein